MDDDQVLLVVLLAAFRGEHLVLLRGAQSVDPMPDGFVGLPSTVARPADAEESALGRLVGSLGKDAQTLVPVFVDRVWLRPPGTTLEVQLVFTCVMSGYYNGIGVKPDKLPKNFFWAHQEPLRTVMKWRKANGFG